MISPIGDPTISPKSVPSSVANAARGTARVPYSITTEATLFAPPGRITDDSARGTIFWESEVEEVEDPDRSCSPEKAVSDAMSSEEPGNANGRPFRIEWQTTNRVPFYRARSLRNPWNANREVKIARDGTELEPSVGRKMIELFGVSYDISDNP